MNADQPAILYKYRDDSPRTAGIITDGKVWLSTANQLNDPLECKTGQIPDTWKKKIISEMEGGQLAGFVVAGLRAISEEKPFFSLTHRATKKWFFRFKRLKTQKEKYFAMRSFIEDHGNELSRPAKLFKDFEIQLSNVGIFSLSECSDNQLMWAHYGGNHKGLAIGFQRDAGSKLQSESNTIRVAYSDVKPVFVDGPRTNVSMSPLLGGVIKSSIKVDFSDMMFRASISTKPMAWGYEREWRYVEENGGLFPWPGPIMEIVFGLNMQFSRRRHYAEIVSRSVSHEVRFYEIVIAPDHSSLVLAPWSGECR